MFIIVKGMRMLAKKYFQIAVAVIIVCITWIAWNNKNLEVNYYTISGSKIPDSFKGYRIALITDLHNDEIGENNAVLLEKLRKEQPDMIAIVGDIVDCYDTDIEIAIDFAAKAVQIAPTYYVTGNHEAFVTSYSQLESLLTEAGILVLHDEYILLEKNNDSICLIGLDDPSFKVDYFTGDSVVVIEDALTELVPESDSFNVLLSHRPELFEVYVDHNIDLVLSGHAHGGQFRLPFIGGLYAPNQGIFPEYDAGLFTKYGTNMIVSRGIGNSKFPYRFNNRPEIIIVELQP